MNVTLPLSPENRAELEKRAAAAGTDVATFILAVVEQTLEANEQRVAAEDLPYEQWKSDFEAWISSHPSRNPNFDDSRESIYD
jgi:hypothetical protein